MNRLRMFPEERGSLRDLPNRRKMKKISAGLLPFKIINNELLVMISHPGGPFYKNKDNGFWSIVKGEVNHDEELFDAAIREFIEETGIQPEGPFFNLMDITQKGGKVVYAWAFMLDYDLEKGFTSNTIEVDWPPKSGKKLIIPEIDKLEYFNTEDAGLKINQAQKEFIQRLMDSF